MENNKRKIYHYVNILYDSEYDVVPNNIINKNTSKKNIKSQNLLRAIDILTDGNNTNVKK